MFTNSHICNAIHTVVSEYLKVQCLRVALEKVAISVCSSSADTEIEVVIRAENEEQYTQAQVGIMMALSNDLPHFLPAYIIKGLRITVVQRQVMKREPIKKEESKMYIPEVVEIIHRESKRGEMFTVVWKDETTTTVKLKEGEESSEYTAYLYALGKKIFKDKGEARAFIKEKKKVFEDRVEQKRIAKERKLKAKQLQREMEESDVADISDLVYGEMFVAPALISRSVFKKNKGDK